VEEGGRLQCNDGLQRKCFEWNADVKKEKLLASPRKQGEEMWGGMYIEIRNRLMDVFMKTTIIKCIICSLLYLTCSEFSDSITFAHKRIIKTLPFVWFSALLWSTKIAAVGGIGTFLMKFGRGALAADTLVRFQGFETICAHLCTPDTSAPALIAAFS